MAVKQLGTTLIAGVVIAVQFFVLSGSSAAERLEQRLPVFPAAQGFGALTPAGRYGEIIKVTNLHDRGPGSLRSALEGSGARIVVFEVAGPIFLEDPLIVKSPFLTLAGQTAPCPGITLVGYGLQIAASDILIQHIFIRVTKPAAKDGIQLKSIDRKVISNIVVDHVSVSWANDENISCFQDSVSNATFSNCLVGEGHYGMLIADGSKNISVIRNLFMSAEERQPRIAGGTSVQIVNNLSYNVGARGSTVVGSKRGGSDVAFVGNDYLDGPDTGKPSYGVRSYGDAASASRLYVPLKGPYANRADHAVIDLPSKAVVAANAPVSLAGLNVLPVGSVEAHVTKSAGARPAERGGPTGDSVDRRLLEELLTRKGAVKGRIKPAWPIPRASSRQLTLPEHPHADDDNDGYTNIEEVLQRLAAEIEGNP